MLDILDSFWTISTRGRNYIDLILIVFKFSGEAHFDQSPWLIATVFSQQKCESVLEWAAQLFGHPFDNMLNMNELDDFAEDLKKDSYVVLDVNKEPLSDDVIVDPMGNEVVVGDGYFMIPEIMFKPSLNNLPGPGLSEAIYLAIEDVDPAYHTLLYGNIVLGGGNCMFPGMGERIVNDLRVMTDHEVSYIAIENREYSAWIGASSS